MKVLVVDDERFNLQVAKSFLTDIFSDEDIRLCDRSDQCLDIIINNNIDIVLLDIFMPNKDGMEVLKEIRNETSLEDVQVIMLTASEDDSYLKTCFEFGANDFIRKPIQAQEFYARINSAKKTRIKAQMLNELLEKVQSQNTELLAMNKTLQDTQFHLVQSEKMAAIGELAAGVAHEINNPIGYVSSNFETLRKYMLKIKDYIHFGYTQLGMVKAICHNDEIDKIMASFEDEYKKRKIDFILEDLDDIVSDSIAGIDKVAEIVRTMRNFARSGNQEEKGFASLVDIIDQAILMSHNEAKYCANIHFDSSAYQPDVYCNKGQIGQVILNLLINAVQAIKGKQSDVFGNINITLEERGKAVVICIADDGPGMTQEVISNIFSPFFTTKEVGEGTGLGLSISYDIIVNKHNGQFDVTSVVGEGTKFYVTLPLYMSEGA